MFYPNLYAIPPFLASLLIISLGIFVWHKNPKSATNFSWFLVCFFIFIWLIGDAMLFSTKDKFLAIYFTHIIYLGVTATPFVNLYFGHRITNKPISKKTIVFFSFLYLMAIYLIFKTNLFIDGLYKFFWGFYPKAGKFHEIYLLVWSALYIFNLTILHKNMTNPEIKKDERNKISFCFWAVLLGGIIGPLDFIQKYGFEFYPMGYFCVPIIIGIITYAILKHNLMDIRVAIKKGIVYSILIATITGIYLLLIMIIEYIFRGVVGYRSIIVSMIFAFIISIIFNPLRNRIHGLVDKIFLGKTSQEMQKENELLKQELERSDRLKATSTLALGLAHEVKNPLTTIKTFAEYLPEKYKDEDFVNKFSKIIPTEVERINSIIHQLLDFSKPSPPIFKETNIHELLMNILTFLNSNFLKKKIKVNEFYADSALSVKADPIQLKQAFLNIFLNAIEAMPTGGDLTIKTEITEDGFLEIIISDTGYGIPKENLKHIFDPFFTTKDSGSGLGLSIAHQIIKNHNGSIKVESELNKGTTFRIKLPLEKKTPEIKRIDYGG